AAANPVSAAMTYDSGVPLAIGAFLYGGQNQTSELFNGLVDEVTLHNRALNDAEVRGLLDGTSPSCPPPNHPPHIDNPGDRTSLEGATISLPVSAHDDDGDALTYSATGLPPGLVIDPLTGVISGQLGFQSAGQYSVLLGVGDGSATPFVS